MPVRELTYKIAGEAWTLVEPLRSGNQSGNDAEVRMPEDWKRRDGETFRIQVLTVQEEDGTFSTIALNLPGAGSCGTIREESLANAKEAIQAVLDTYKASSTPIPWQDVSAEDIGVGELRVIFVHA